MTGPQSPIGEDDLQAYVDDRLDPARRAAVEAYLAGRPDLGDRVAAERRLRAALRAELAAKGDEPIPARLRIANIQAARRARWLVTARNATAGVALFLLGAAGGWYADRFYGNPPPTTSISQSAAAAHRTFVVEVVHPVEVVAAQEAHLVQWLSKRLSRPLVAPNLSRLGYKLMGGRLLPGGSAAAAQLMYDDAAGKRLTVYVRATEGTETAFTFWQEGNTATFAWIERGFGFAVTAQATREELLPIAEAVYRDLAGKG